MLFTLKRCWTVIKLNVNWKYMLWSKYWGCRKHGGLHAFKTTRLANVHIKHPRQFWHKTWRWYIYKTVVEVLYVHLSVVLFWMQSIYRDAQLFSCSIKAKPATYSTKNYFRFERLFTTLKVKMVSVFQRTYRQAERLSWCIYWHEIGWSKTRKVLVFRGDMSCHLLPHLYSW
jgi:hypothetical protein